MRGLDERGTEIETIVMNKLSLYGLIKMSEKKYCNIIIQPNEEKEWDKDIPGIRMLEIEMWHADYLKRNLSVQIIQVYTCDWCDFKIAFIKFVYPYPKCMNDGFMSHSDPWRRLQRDGSWRLGNIHHHDSADSPWNHHSEPTPRKPQIIYKSQMYITSLDF